MKNNVSALLFLDMELQGHLDGQVIRGRYRYMCHLHALDACRPKEEPMHPEQRKEVYSHLIVEEWQSALEGHPDPDFVSYILSGQRRFQNRL